MPRRRLSEDEKRERKIARELAAAARRNSDEFRAHQREQQRKDKARHRMRERTEPEYKARTLDMHRKQQARWGKANPGCIADAQRKWKAKQDPELLRQYGCDAYAANPEPQKARSRAYYRANKERILAKQRAKRA